MADHAVSNPRNRDILVLEWDPLTTADTDGTPTAEAHVPWSDRCVHIVQTGTAATVALQGSNDGSNWATLNDVNGNGISGTGTNLVKQVQEVPLYVRPVIASGGDGTTSVKVIIVARRSNDLRQ